MLAKHSGYKPQNLPNFLKMIEILQGRAKRSLWYRGCGQASYPLVPSLYRHPSTKDKKEITNLEVQLMTRFRQRSIPYHTRNLADGWDALFFMQHYGVPTRLLDWTENPLVALHFALMSAPRSKRGKHLNGYRQPAAVWVLDPTSWNRSALAHLSYDGGPLTPGDEALKGYAPLIAAESMNKYPVALFGAHNSSRIVAQQGVFVIFGRERTSMDQLIDKKRVAGSTLTKVIISPTRIPGIRKTLLNHGITESAVFPGLEGLSQEIKRYFGFEG
jgi:hypothetical protein